MITFLIIYFSLNIIRTIISLCISYKAFTDQEYSSHPYHKLKYVDWYAIQFYSYIGVFIINLLFGSLFVLLSLYKEFKQLT